jgi:hypothetical protein
MDLAPGQNAALLGRGWLAGQTKRAALGRPVEVVVVEADQAAGCSTRQTVGSLTSYSIARSAMVSPAA